MRLLTEPDVDPDSALARGIAARGVPRRFLRDETLTAAGEGAGSAFLIRHGFARVCAAPRGGREVVIGLRGPGDLVGELSILDGRPRSATVVAVTPLDATAVAAADFRRMLREDADALRELMRTMATRLRDADLARVEFAALGTLGRVASRLLELAERLGLPDDGGTRVDLPLSQQELASWCGSSRESTVKALRTLRELGCVSTGRGAVLIHDAAALERHARPALR